MEQNQNAMVELDALLLDIVAGGTEPVAASYLPFVISAQAAPTA
jgi:hypothetical protein